MWEIAVKIQIGKLDLPRDSQFYLRHMFTLKAQVVDVGFTSFSWSAGLTASPQRSLGSTAGGAATGRRHDSGYHGSIYSAVRCANDLVTGAYFP